MNERPLHEVFGIDGRAARTIPRVALLDDEISQGLLVRPFSRSEEPDGAYYLIHPPSARNRPNVKAFCEWLLLEARTTGVLEAKTTGA